MTYKLDKQYCFVSINRKSKTIIDINFIKIISKLKIMISFISIVMY